MTSPSVPRKPENQGKGNAVGGNAPSRHVAAPVSLGAQFSEVFRRNAEAWRSMWRWGQ